MPYPIPSDLYISFEGIQTYFVNKDDGAPLSGGYVKFWSDPSRTVTKDVFQQVRQPDNSFLFVNIGSTVTLTAVGTFGSPSDGSDIQVYAFPYEGTEEVPGAIQLYYVSVYSSDNILQFTRDAVPSNVADSQSIDEFEGSDNQIENPQFVVTFLPGSNTAVLSLTGTDTVTSIAPNWDLITTGTDTVTVTQEAIAASDVPTNPPFAINIQGSAGVTSMKLRQRFTNSPRLMGRGYISATMIAKSFDPGAVLLTMDYVASSGYTANLINASTNALSTYTVLKNDLSTETASTSTDSGSAGYVDIVITIPTNTYVGISSVQIVSVENENSSTPFLQESSLRQVDHLFNYYNLPLQFKPGASLLSGWDFGLNPAQLGTTFTITASAAYTWDQTICARANNNNTVARNGATGGFQVTTGGINDAFYMMQYLSGEQARKILGSPLSVNVNAWKTAAGGEATVRVYLFRGTAAASIPTLSASIGTLAATGVFTLVQAGWTEIPRPTSAKLTDTVKTITDNAGINSGCDYGFNGWQVTSPSEIADTDKFACVVTFAHPSAATVFTIQSISVCNGSIPTRPAAKTYVETLSDCQYYYEKSYAPGINPGTIISGGCLQGIQAVSTPAVTSSLIPQAFGWQFKQPARVTNPTILLYSPETGAVNNVRGDILNFTPAGDTGDLAITNWNQLQLSATGVSYEPANATGRLPITGSTTTNAWIYWHYTKDARLGVI